MAPEPSTLSKAVQVRLIELPTIPVGLGGERDTDVIKPLGTEGKQTKTLSYNVFSANKQCTYLFHRPFP